MPTELDRPSLDAAEARRLTDEARADLAALLDKLHRLHEGGAHLALGYPSWSAYCEAEFGFARTKAYRLLHAAEVVAQLPMGNSEPLPASERVARELAPLRASPGQLREAWRAAVQVYGPEPTAAQVRAIVEALRGIRARLRRDEAGERVGRLRDLASEVRAVGANDLGALADGIAEPVARRAWLTAVERDALEVAAAATELARLARVVDGPIVFNVGHGVYWRRDGVAPTLLASEVPLVVLPAEPREAA